MEVQYSRLEDAVNEVRSSLSLAPVSDVKSTAETKQHELSMNTINSINSSEDLEDDIPSPSTESLASAPIRSLYEVTQKPIQEASTAHSPPTSQSSGTVLNPDFISKGIIDLPEAERLAALYLSRIDFFFYGNLQKYPDFATIRKVSTLLALCVCTVAALHDPHGSESYEKLSHEISCVVSTLMFKPRWGLEDIRSLCIASYWLSDMAWMLSGIGMRKAISMHFHKAHFAQPGSDKEGYMKSQLWLFLYLNNEQISLLQGVPPSGIGRDYVKWEHHMSSPFSSNADFRYVSHIDLLLLLSQVRELFGLDTSKPIPEMLVPQLREFNNKIDRWGSAWSGKLNANRVIGDFPSEAVKLNYHFAKFYLCSHAFRGLHFGEEDEFILLRDTEDIAATAITTAISVLQLLLDSKELREGLVGSPHYFHTMFTFTAVFLLKLPLKYTELVSNFDMTSVLQTIRKVVDVFVLCACAKQHLLHRITVGLDRLLEAAEQRQRNKETKFVHHDSTNGNSESGFGEQLQLNDPLMENFDFLASMPLTWSTSFYSM